MYNFQIVNADTDSISFCKQDRSLFTEDETITLLKELNSIYPEKIKFEDDGVFDCLVVLKAKNYIKLHDGILETKGSALRNPNREPALREFISKAIDCFVYDRQHEIINIYNEYIREIFNVKDISRFCTKKTITNAVLNPERTTEQKVLDALGNRKVQMGDKHYFYFKEDESLGHVEDWNNDHNKEKLLGKLYNTISVFTNVYDMTQVPKYHLKAHKIKCQLADVLGVPHPEKVKRGKKSDNNVVVI